MRRRTAKRPPTESRATASPHGSTTRSISAAVDIPEPGLGGGGACQPGGCGGGGYEYGRVQSQLPTAVPCSLHVSVPSAPAHVHA